MAEGSYTAYARRLDIQRGRLIFTGGAIDDPGIDVRAQKQFPDVTAGVNVRGTLLQPHMSFFSDPPLPQSQIVSLILAGGSLNSAQNSSNAATRPGGGAARCRSSAPRVGLPDVSLETDPVANETSLVLGRYLSPRLYVSYGVSLTETAERLQAALHARRSLDDPQRDGHGARRRPGVLDRQVAPRRARAAARPGAARGARAPRPLTPCALKCTICACLCGWQYQAMLNDTQQLERRDAIVRILREGLVGKQQDLVRLLKRAGHEATQSSISRDLRDLGVLKASGRYVLPPDEVTRANGDFGTLTQFVRALRRAGPAITVLRTTIGAAQSVAVAIDKAEWPEVAGTISGDDTIFIATANQRAQDALVSRLGALFGL